MEIHVCHPAVNKGTETRLDVDMTDIYELLATPGGVRSMADVDMAVPLGSPAHKVLHAIYESASREPMRLCTEQHVSMWGILSYRWPTVPGDGLVRLTLRFLGSADAA